jgi:hypothetical protein
VGIEDNTGMPVAHEPQQLVFTVFNRRPAQVFTI